VTLANAGDHRVISPGELLSGGLGKASMDAFRAFSRHAAQCGPCDAVRMAIVGGDEAPERLYDDCCDQRDIYGTWLLAKQELVAHLKALTAPWGLAGLVGAALEARAAALTALPAEGARDIFETDDLELREAKIRAVMAARRPSAVAEPLASSAGPDEVVCKGCGMRFVPPEGHTYQRFHNKACGQRYRRMNAKEDE
jgi:hypothetical protein